MAAQAVRLTSDLLLANASLQHSRERIVAAGFDGYIQKLLAAGAIGLSLRKLDQTLELKHRAGMMKLVRADLFPAYDDDGGLLAVWIDGGPAQDSHGEVGTLPGWLLDVSPFSHVPNAPAVAIGPPLETIRTLPPWWFALT